MAKKGTIPNIQKCNHGFNKNTIGSHGETIVIILGVFIDSGWCALVRGGGLFQTKSKFFFEKKLI